MKIKPDATKLQLNSSSSYNVFKTYSSARYNEPYIAAVFDGKDFEQYKMFAIGKSHSVVCEYNPSEALLFEFIWYTVRTDVLLTVLYV